MMTWSDSGKNKKKGTGPFLQIRRTGLSFLETRTKGTVPIKGACPLFSW